VFEEEKQAWWLHLKGTTFVCLDCQAGFAITTPNFSSVTSLATTATGAVCFGLDKLKSKACLPPETTGWYRPYRQLPACRHLSPGLTLSVLRHGPNTPGSTSWTPIDVSGALNELLCRYIAKISY
jgi:hypothetical protein